MILISASIKYGRAVCTACCKNQINNAYSIGTKRLLNTEVGVPRTFKAANSVRTMVKENKNKIDGFGIILLVIPVSAFGLGTWQIQRKIQKEKLISDLKKRTSLEPVDLPKDLSKLEDMEYHPVKVKGKFDHSKEIYMGPRTIISQTTKYSRGLGLLSTGGSGYLVLTPFTLSDRNLTILVNRGWVPSSQRHPGTRPQGQITEEVELVGLVRHSEPRQPLGLKNLPEQGFWTYRDLDKFSEATGAAPVLIDAIHSSSVPGGPVGGQTVVGLKNDHFTYIVTWYTLGAATGYMWFTKYMK